MMKEEHHIKWLKVVKACIKIKHEGRKIIGLETLWRILSEMYPHEFNLENLKESLKLANSAGFVIYRDCLHLDNSIILDQDYLIDIMKEFVSPRKQTTMRLPCHWDQLQNEGIAHWDLMKDVFRCTKIDMEPTLEYLKELDLIHELPPSTKKNQEDCDRMFLIPTKLERCEVLPFRQDSSEATEFYFDFQDFPVEDIYTRLLCRCLNHQDYDIYDSVSHNPKVYRNCAFIVRPGKYSQLIEIMQPRVSHQHLMKLNVWPVEGYSKYHFLMEMAEIVHCIVKRDFPYLRYVAGPRCPNPHCDTMRSADYIHILLLLDSDIRKLRPGETSHVACGQQHYRIHCPLLRFEVSILYFILNNWLFDTQH